MTVFSISAPEANEVYIAGDFNDWKLDNSSRMERKDGTWNKSIELKPGQHRYRFVVDGKWIDDPNNPNREVNPYGEMDSLIEVTTNKG